MNPGLQVTPMAPIMVGRRRAKSNVITSYDHVPARVVRGAWVRHRLDKGLDIDPLVLESLRFGNLFPTPPGSGEPVRPMPLTLATCKAHPGFRADGGHGGLDTLFARGAYQGLSVAGTPPAIAFAPTCACGNRIKRFSGLHSIVENSRRIIQVGRANQTRVGLAPTRRAAEEGLLYTTSAMTMPDGWRLEGATTGTDDELAEVIDALNARGLGAKTGSGLGRVSAAVGSIVAFDSIESRLGACDAAFRKVWLDIARLSSTRSSAPEGTFFTITLAAPAILSDAHGLPTLVPPLDEMFDADIRPVAWAARSETVTGWSDAWGLPKPARAAAAAGSAWLFHAPLMTTGDLAGPLRSLERTGLGDRCDEGYGQIHVSDPVHTHLEEV